MTTLEERRRQADMLYVYNILTRREDVDKGEWFTVATEAGRSTRSMDGSRSGGTFFSVRVSGQ